MQKFYSFETLAALFDEATQMWKDEPFAQFVDGGQYYTYNSFKDKVFSLHDQLQRCGVGAGDKVAILAENMPHWTVSFFACVRFGAVAVPLLAGCSAAELEKILAHSEAKVLIISQSQLPKLSEADRTRLAAVIDIEDFHFIATSGDAPAPGTDALPERNTLATIIYTSGTSGQAKGVMLSHGNLSHSVLEAWHAQKATHKDRWMSILPMAHAYEMAFGMLYPIYAGASVYYIHGLPTPRILLDAMRKVRPALICSVPLIIEKIHKVMRKKVAEKPLLTWMDAHTPWLLDKLLGRELNKNLGGKIKFFGIGGAKLNPEVERFLHRSGFNYAIGYGLTETSPLITNACVGKTAVGSIGVPAYGVEVRLDNVNPQTGEGEIIARGPNVMLGYYKDPERTASVMEPDGWFHTGDLAVCDKKGRYYIRGRLGNVILGANGENIYPEEIEEVLNNYPSVSESLVVERDKKLVALVKLEEGVEALTALGEKIKTYVNERVRKNSALARVEFVKEAFKKTATQKIRRFLYREKK
ncbi:MAG: AMP-binding protein [Bacteroidales bacterium]|nr:AMP-binding protein [Bacteroidales bacterium]